MTEEMTTMTGTITTMTATMTSVCRILFEENANYDNYDRNSGHLGLAAHRALEIQIRSCSGVGDVAA